MVAFSDSEAGRASVAFDRAGGAIGFAGRAQASSSPADSPVAAPSAPRPASAAAISSPLAKRSAGRLAIAFRQIASSPASSPGRCCDGGGGSA